MKFVVFGIHGCGKSAVIRRAVSPSDDRMYPHASPTRMSNQPGEAPAAESVRCAANEQHEIIEIPGFDEYGYGTAAARMALYKRVDLRALDDSTQFIWVKNGSNPRFTAAMRDMFSLLGDFLLQNATSSQTAFEEALVSCARSLCIVVTRASDMTAFRTKDTLQTYVQTLADRLITALCDRLSHLPSDNTRQKCVDSLKQSVHFVEIDSETITGKRQSGHVPENTAQTIRRRVFHID